MRVRRQEDDNLEIQMAPLIDCVFILLIFFLVATTLKVSQQSEDQKIPQIPLTLPQSAAAIEAAPDEEKVLVLAIDKDGRQYVDGEMVSTGELNRRLEAAGQANPKPRVRLDADRDTRFSELIEIIELCQFQGLRDVGLHTRKTDN